MPAARRMHDRTSAVVAVQSSPGAASPSAELGPRTLTVVLATFSFISALAGGVELLAWPNGNDVVPRTLLANTPFASFLVPGLLLGIVIGGTSLACAILVWRRSRAAIDATVLAGGALTVWIVAEAGMMREVHWLHGIFGVLGATLLGLGVREAWRSNRLRHRWVLSVTLAETLGFFVPACAGVVATRSGLGEPAQAGVVITAGFIEGLLLGAGQAWALPIPVRRVRYALLTSLGAGVVWLCVMSMMPLLSRASLPVAVIVGSLAGLVGLASIGAAQWLELRAHVGRAHLWIGWTALAWALALPLSFAPGPFVDASTPLASQLVLWACGGLLMAHVMALTTWQGVRRLLQSAHPPLSHP
jgi:hypothetical protein